MLLTFWLPSPPHHPLNIDDAIAISSVLPRERTYRSVHELHDATNVSPDAFKPLHQFCEANGFEVIDTHWRSAVVRGATGRFIEALSAGVELSTIGGRPFRARVGAMQAPPALAGIVRVALGLHQWPKSAPLETASAPDASISAKRPSIQEICERYGVPAGDGSGETIAVIQLNAKFAAADFTASMNAARLSPAMPTVRRIDNAALKHKKVTTKDVESSIDTQIAAMVAPGARIVIYEAPNSERGLLDALRTAIFDREFTPSIVSISFGWGELVWTPVVLDLLNELFAAAALLGITIVCASGDYGLAPPRFAVAPAASPLALACGATVGGAIGAEAVWEKSGGGLSSHFHPAPWQSPAVPDHAGRGTPDLCAEMEFSIWMGGIAQISGGTSAVAPFVAGAIARLNQRLGVRCGLFTGLLYGADARACFRTVSQEAATPDSQAAWTPRAGLGAPRFDRLERLFTPGANSLEHPP